MGRRDVLEIMDKLRERSTVFYSTHILDDVQRVSDTVAILNRGELVAQAPIDELLAGSGGTVYAIEVKGDASQARARISGEPWVRDIHIVPDSDRAEWQVSVTDAEAAEAHLLRLVLADEHITVTRFGRKRYNLEEVFLELIEGDDRVR